MLSLLWEIVRKDLKVFVSDPKAMLISFAVPIAIASFIGSIFGGMGSNGPAKPIPLLVVDLDSSAVTKSAAERLKGNPSVDARASDLAAAREAVRSGKAGVAVVYPKGFGDAAVSALTNQGPAPDLQTLVDPANALQAQAVRGVLMSSTMEAVGQAASGSQVAPKMPFNFQTESVTPESTNNWDGVAHAFAGMAIQGLLFWSIEAAMGILRERRLGLWKRLRAAPVPGQVLLLGRLLSTAVRAFMILTAVIGFGMIFFHIRVLGSWAGLLVLGAAAATMAGAFGLFVASLGKTEAQSRGLTVLAVLTMTMLGGAWFPTFLMPTWVQTISLAVPVHWAVDGLDAMTWRGSGIMSAFSNAGALLCFAAIFAAIALTRFRFEAE